MKENGKTVSTGVNSVEVDLVLLKEVMIRRALVLNVMFPPGVLVASEGLKSTLRIIDGCCFEYSFLEQWSEIERDDLAATLKPCHEYVASSVIMTLQGLQEGRVHELNLCVS
jgi:hypothetical protein